VTHLDRIVSRVILLAKLPGNQRRCEVAKELRAHLDDLAEEARSQGYDDQAIARIVRMRFGEPEPPQRSLLFTRRNDWRSAFFSRRYF
jgi:uncharacterized protein (UPF0335 family)